VEATHSEAADERELIGLTGRYRRYGAHGRSLARGLHYFFSVRTTP